MLIQQLRDGSEGILAKIIIGLIIIVFALFGFGSITTFLAPTPKVAEVNGEEVSQQQMELSVERNRRMQLARGVPFEQIDEDALREQVLNTLVAREILSQTADELNLFYSDTALDREIVATEIFQFDGVFNPDQFQNVIRGAGYTPLSYRDELRQDKLFEQMVSGIARSSFVTEDESRWYASLLSQTRDIAFLQIRVDDLLDEVSVTEEEIADYYNENLGDFVTDETVVLEYVELKHDQLAEALEVVEGDLQAFYEERKGNYAVEETRRIAHILVEISEEVTSDAAKEKATEIHERIKNGEDFAALAAELSDDPGSAQNGGDLGFNPRGVFVPEFDAVAFELSVNQLSEPVETEFGFHIIRVLDIEEGSTPSLDELRGEMVAAYRLWATEDEFVTQSARLSELLFESLDLEVPAAELGLDIQSTEALPRSDSHFLMSDDRMVAAIFSPDVLLDGNNSDLVELDDSHHVGVRVVEHTPAATRPLAEVSDDIRYILQRTAAQEMAEARAQEIVEAIEGGSLSLFVANQYGLEWQTFNDVSRFLPSVPETVRREAFQLPRPAENRESIGAALETNGDALVLRVSQVTNRETSDIVESELNAIRNNLAGQFGAVDFQEFENGLTEAASVTRVN